MRKPYSKPWLSPADQLGILEQRGMIVSNRQFAVQFLTHVNYYRFSGYCLAFEASRHVFQPGTTFDRVFEAYQFDLTLRDLLTEALEFLEVDLRSSLAHSFGEKYGAFGHVSPGSFFHRFNHAEWLTRLREEAERSSELFVTHCQVEYSEFPDLAVWIATEIMSFGGLSRMYQGMFRRDQTNLAKRLSIQPQILESWIHFFVYLRNLCAHHSRVWDRRWAIRPQVPTGKQWQAPFLPSNKFLFAALLICRYWLRRIKAIESFSDSWKIRVEAHISNPPQVNSPLERMGLNAKWNLHPFWNY